MESRLERSTVIVNDEKPKDSLAWCITYNVFANTLAACELQTHIENTLGVHELIVDI